jgi:hypothetical protein
MAVSAVLASCALSLLSFRHNHGPLLVEGSDAEGIYYFEDISRHQALFIISEEYSTAAIRIIESGPSDHRVIEPHGLCKAGNTTYFLLWSREADKST